MLHNQAWSGLHIIRWKFLVAQTVLRTLGLLTLTPDETSGHSKAIDLSQSDTLLAPKRWLRKTARADGV
jgi:hypothetical protein